MAAADKLLPNALSISNNLRGIKNSTRGTYRLPAKKASKYSNPYVDAVEFIANIYNRELKIAIANMVTDTQKVPQSPLLPRRYTPNVNQQDITLGTIVAFSEFEWKELQVTISKIVNMIYPFDLALGTGDTIIAAITNAGGPGPVGGTYLSVPSVNITGTGTGALFDVVVTNPIGITSITCVNPGSGYQIGDTFNFFGNIPGSLAEILTITALSGSIYTTPQITEYNTLMGVFDNGGGANATLRGADNAILGSFVQGIAFANAWNDIKVPYDQSIGVKTFFIAPIFKPAGATKFYYRFTGERRWFDFIGYNL